METKPLKVSFTVEFDVKPEEHVASVLQKVHAVRKFIRQLGYVRLGVVRIEGLVKRKDGLMEALTTSF